MSQQAAREWLRTHPVPPGGTGAFSDWRAEVADLPEAWLPSVVAALADEDFAVQYAALIALREHGYDAVGEGFGQTLTYRVVSPKGEELVIKPSVAGEQ